MTSDSVSEAPDLDRGPSLLLPVLVTIAGAALALHELVELIRHVPAAGRPRPMNGALLSLALALGGFSGARLLQLMAFAGARHRRAAENGSDRAADGSDLEVPWQLTDAQSLHGVWVIAVGGSLALMGALGLWSLLEGAPSGLEPGWPLLLLGGAVALCGRILWLRTSAHWAGAGDGL